LDDFIFQFGFGFIKLTADSVFFSVRFFVTRDRENGV